MCNRYVPNIHVLKDVKEKRGKFNNSILLKIVKYEITNFNGNHKLCQNEKDMNRK